MKKEKGDDDSSVGWTYGGKEEEWDSFDRRMMRYMRKKLDSFGEKLWTGEIVDIAPLEKKKFGDYVLEVYKALRITQPREAKELIKKNSDFFKKAWHEQWLARQANLMVDHIEDHAVGQAEVEVVNYSGDKKMIRLHLYKQFGAGSGGDIHSQELEYEKGMPDGNGVAFRPGMDITVKLRQLEGRKIYFWKMCEPAKRKKYVFCQETKLVRIVLEHINDDYKTCVDRLLDYVKVKKLVDASSKGKASSSFTDLPNSLDRSFNDDWLPSWTNLQACLIEEYRKFMKEGKFPCGKSAKNSDKIPVAFGPLDEVVCYACGQKAHKAGDPNCRAGPFDVAPIAPKEFRDRREAKKRKSEGGAQQGNGKKLKATGGKKPCFDFAKGICKRGSACKFEHDKAAGDKGKGITFNAKQKKAIKVMLNSVVKSKLTEIAKKGKAKKDKTSDDESDFAAALAPFFLAPCMNRIPRHPVHNKNIVMAINLHEVDKTCGIDSDAGMSISTLESDFIWLDRSPNTIGSLASPTGINGGSSEIGGIGPMLVRAHSGEYLIDPNAVYLKNSKDQPNFRVMATQRLKRLGVRLVGCFEGTEDDVLQDRVSGKTITLTEEGRPDKSILVLSTQKVPKFPVTNCLRQVVANIAKGNRTGLLTSLNTDDVLSDHHNQLSESKLKKYSIDFGDKVLLFNVAKCTTEERSRLYVRRFGYCDSNLFPRMCKDPDFGELPNLCVLNEDNPVKDASKFRKLTHHRTDPALSQRFPCWGRTYVDGYGGGQSMGEESYDGAIGGYLFKCPATGDAHHKLYASHEQFPAAVFQFLTHVEGEGHRCHELYVDTFSVNISSELEEVVAMFQCKVVAISAGTPQELAFVETAHRVIAGRSRAMLLGAPHLPGWCWALADKHAVYVGRYLPQSSRNWKSAYFLNTGRAPDWRNLSIHVFGAPCRFAELSGPVHKRSEVTIEGYYVGVQHPMVLILRKSDLKLLSCSRKKFVVYESAYISPLAHSPNQLKDAVFNAEVPEKDKDQIEQAQGEASLQHVQSIKSMSSHRIPPPHTTATQLFRPPTVLDTSADSQNPNQGEGVVVPEHKTYQVDLSSGIRELQRKAESSIAKPSVREKVLSTLEAARRTIDGEIDSKQLKKGKITKNKIDVSNVILTKRRRAPVPVIEAEEQKREVAVVDAEERNGMMLKRKLNKVKKKVEKVKGFRFQVGDGVSVSAKIFDGDEPGSFSKENPERQLGIVVKILPDKDIVEVEWLDGSVDSVDRKDLRIERPKATAAMILTVMLETFKKGEDPMDKDKWPKNFFEALVRPDWRSWVEAVKKEISSWLTFDAYSEIAFSEKTHGASIVPLGELYTRKRDLSYKFRQYLMGNLLMKGKDYDETFSSCISWDGIRWCASVACAMSKQMRGCDAVTGFLQAREKFDLYAYLPSHGRYSSLSFEDLAILREQLLKLVDKEGEAGLKKFAAIHKKESRSNPKSCYRLNSSIYGAPSANHEWDLLFQGAHINECGLTLSEIEPSLYVRVETNKDDEVVEWMIAHIWTDDVRYFGTDDLLKRYEENLQKKIKVKFLGVPEEFVGTEFVQDLHRGLCELKAPKYWEGAAQKFVKHFPKGIKERHNPLSIQDEKFMLTEEISDEQVEEAKHLPYRELLGVVSYHASCTKLEMRYAVSICGRHRGRWGVEQFNVVKKMFEYGYTTRHTGLIYSKGLDSHGENVLSCYADSGHSLPRSHGGTTCMLNGAAVSHSAKKHSLTASGTYHDEIIEFSIAANKVVGFRNMMEEMNLSQDKPTTIYQDNEAAIQIIKNRGSMSGQSRHIERRVLTSRNKVEDGQVMPVYIDTTRMVADIGTKAFGDKQFAYLRDLLTGYSLVKKHHPSYKLPSYIV
jgi:hypothetical protein